MPRKTRAKRRGGPGRLSAAAAAKIPDRLLDAALALFHERGFGSPSMETIARRAGASTKTLYARFANKAQVLEAVVNRLVAGATADVVVPLDPSRTDPRTFIVALATRMATGIAKDSAGFTTIALSEARRFPAIAKMYDASLADARAIFAAALARWHADGRLPELKNPNRAAMLLVSMVSDMGRIRTAMGHPMSDAEIASYIPDMTDLFLRGCGYTAKKVEERP